MEPIEIKVNENNNLKYFAEVVDPLKESAEKKKKKQNQDQPKQMEYFTE